MPYRLSYHPAVLREDLPRLNRDIRDRIQRALEQRLALEPAYYGEPLRHQLKGYWKLRVGNYRIIYRIESHTVWIITIGHRKDVYAVPVQRLIWHP